MARPVLDAHLHLWRLADRRQPWIDPATMAVIARDHEWPELERELDASGVTDGLLVQVINDRDESVDFLQLAARTDRLVGVVAWDDLVTRGIGARLDGLAELGPLVGVRHQAQAEPDPGAWLAAFAEGEGPGVLADRGLVCDLMLRPEQLALCAAVVRRYDGLAWVLDHAGKPPVVSGWGSEQAATWRRLMAPLARMPHLVVKLSGLTTMADPAAWTPADLEPWTDHLLVKFGPERLIFGSDWPVSRRAGEYARTFGAVQDLLARLSPDEQDRVLRGTAEETYGLRGRFTPRAA